jgi:hypothetical protein
MDVKNTFLNGDLHEEVYMDITPGFEPKQNFRRVLWLCQLVYGLKQSPRSWFNRFRQAMLKRGYQQSNADHTLFYKHVDDNVVVLTVYVDDIVITCNGLEEVNDVK